MLHRHFLGAQNDVSMCMQHRAVGAVLPSDTALATSEVLLMATGALPAAPVLLADTMLAGPMAAAAEAPPAAADDVPVTADDPSTTAHAAPSLATVATLPAVCHTEKAMCKAAQAFTPCLGIDLLLLLCLSDVQRSNCACLLSARALQSLLRHLHVCGQVITVTAWFVL